MVATGTTIKDEPCSCVIVEGNKEEEEDKTGDAKADDNEEDDWDWEDWEDWEDTAVVGVV